MVRIKRAKTIKDKLKQKGLIKLILPKLSTVFINILELGPRVVMRSVIYLVKVNPITRLVSVLTLVAVDLFLYFKKKISGTQLMINLMFSGSMMVGSTVGWYAGEGIAKQFTFDFLLGLYISFITMFIGIHIFNVFTERLVIRWFTSDVDKGLEMVNKYCSTLGVEVNEEITKTQALDVFRTQLNREGVIREMLWPYESCRGIYFKLGEVVDGIAIYQYYPNEGDDFGLIMYKLEDKSITVLKRATCDAAGCFIEQSLLQLKVKLEKSNLPIEIRLSR